jgi:iron complex outermembrane receptor protein
MAGGSALALVFGDVTLAQAQTVSNNQIQEVVVTARKRSEDVLKVPDAVTALTGTDIAVRGIETLGDLSNFTPGLTDDQANGGGARSDRSFQQLIIRGMNPSSTLNPTTSIFINSVPVGSADFLQNLDDVQRVEVLKGPQSAYFGRETFAGAVNVITNPATNDWTGHFNAEIATRETYNVSGSVSGPIIADKLSLLVGGSYDAHAGSYINADNPGQTLGDQSTRSFHVALTATPFEHLSVKAFYTIFQDDDGPAATGILIATGAGAFNQGNCTVAGTPFFCGTLPSLISAVSPAQNTTVTPALAQFFANPGGLLGPGEAVRGFGLKRDAYHADVNVEYDIPQTGLTLNYLFGYNSNRWSEVSDLSNIDGTASGQYPGYPGFPFEVQNTAHDVSHEVRLTSDASKPYRGMIGFSYLDSFTEQGLGLAPFGVAPTGLTESRTTGVYFSLAYDVLPQLTIDFDGRYQEDREIAYNVNGTTAASGTSRNFLPRVSVQYRFTPEVMTYFTYSEGVNPGLFNTQYNAIPTVSQNELNQLGVAGGLVVKPENITNYEIGVKGRFFDGRMTLSADIYYDKWTNQLNQESYNFAANDPANPYNVVGGLQYIPGNTSIYPYSYTDNSASSTPKGVEVDAVLLPADHVTVNLSYAFNDTRYTAYNCSTNCLPYPAFQAAGKYLPNAPLNSATLGAQYDNELNLFGQTETWFVRGDFVYRDGVYIESSNTVKTPDIALLNLRGGISWKRVSVEGFINNLTNSKAYTSGFQDVNFGNFSFAPTVVMVGLPQLITGGVVLKYRF